MTPPTAAWSVVVHLVGHHDLYLELALSTSSRILAGHEGPATWSAGCAVLEAIEVMPAAELNVVGDRLEWSAPAALSWSPAKVRDRLAWKSAAPPLDALAGARLTAIRMPILAPVIERQRAVAGPNMRRALIVVTTGPQNGQERGPSTESVGKALVAVLGRTALGEALEVRHLHHETESPHRFGDLPAFVRRLNGHLAEFRRDVVAVHGDKWDRHLKIALSVNTGPTAVISGLVRGTEEFHPHMIHVADARRWPVDAKGVALPFAAVQLDTDGVRQNPAVDRSAYAHDEVVSLACTAMDEWQHVFRSLRPIRPTEKDEGVGDPEHFFWFRKGAQEVLALLVVRDPTDPAQLRTFRGVNLEVSLPTGTLCAERNAIGSAFAALPTLERRHILAVAVLSLGKSPRLGPCGACAEWLRKMAEANPDLRVVTFDDADCAQIFVDPVR